MLPRVMPPTATVQQALPIQAAVPAEAPARSPSPAAALANLRAEVLLRLLETMLRHMPHGPEGAASRNLLEVLLATLKTLPDRNGEGGRKLADLLTRVPSDVRPAVEKLVATALSALPTRSLAEILRNPGGPAAQKLATLLLAALPPEDGGEIRNVMTNRPQRFATGLTAQQIAAMGRHATPGMQSAAGTGDARTLQMMLKRIFELETGKTGPSTIRLASNASLASRDAATIASNTLSTAGKTASADGKVEQTARTANNPDRSGERYDARPATAHATGEGRSIGRAFAMQATPATEGADALRANGRMAEANATVAAEQRATPGNARTILHAVAEIVSNLTDEEVQIVRTLLEAPLPETADGNAGDPARPDPAVDEQTTASLPENEGEAPGITKQAEQAVRRTETAMLSPAPAPHQPETAEQRPAALPPTREGAALAAPEARPESIAAQALMREGVPHAFIPYLTAPDDLEEHEAAKSEDDEEDTSGEDGEQPAGDDSADEEENSAEEESSDMARRREKTAEMLGPLEPGLIFYQKLGDYWT